MKAYFYQSFALQCLCIHILKNDDFYSWAAIAFAVIAAGHFLFGKEKL